MRDHLIVDENLHVGLIAKPCAPNPDRAIVPLVEHAALDFLNGRAGRACRSGPNVAHERDPKPAAPEVLCTSEPHLVLDAWFAREVDCEAIGRRALDVCRNHKGRNVFKGVEPGHPDRAVIDDRCERDKLVERDLVVLVAGNPIPFVHRSRNDERSRKLECRDLACRGNGDQPALTIVDVFDLLDVAGRYDVGFERFTQVNGQHPSPHGRGEQEVAKPLEPRDRSGLHLKVGVHLDACAPIGPVPVDDFHAPASERGD